MAHEALYEESAQSQRAKSEAKMYMTFHVLSLIFLAAAVLLLVIFVTIQLPVFIGYKPEEGATISVGDRAISALVSLLPTISCALGWFLFFWMKKRYNVSFDYLFVEDELRITKVFNGKRRKPLVKLQADKMLKIGYCDKESFERTIAGMDKRSIKYMTPNQEPAEEKLMLYILYSSQVGKTVYIIECRQLMLEYLVRAAGRQKFERQ